MEKNKSINNEYYYEGERIYLRSPRESDKEAVLDFKAEFALEGKTPYGSGSLKDAESFEAWLEKVRKYEKKENVPENRVPATQLLTFRKSDNRLIGMVNVRHYLTEELISRGGHIGDCVRQSERNKGYGTEQISLSFKLCKDLNIEKVLIMCDDDNPASRKTILKNGGVFDSSEAIDGSVKERYYITLKD